MNDRLTTVCVDVESLKRSQSPRGQGEQLPDGLQPGTLPSNAAPSVISMPNNVFGSDDNDNVATCLTWEEQMELEDNPADVDFKSGKHPKGEKLRLTKVEESTEDFLREVFKPMSNEDQKELRGKFIVPDTTVTTPPCLDKLMAMDGMLKER